MRTAIWRQLLTILLIFLGGFCVGFAVSINVIHRGFREVVLGGELPDTQEVVKALDELLDLDEGQETQIRQILDEEFAVLAAQRSASQQRLQAEHEQIIMRLSGELNEEQRGKLHKHFMKFEDVIDPQEKLFEHMHELHQHGGH